MTDNENGNGGDDRTGRGLAGCVFYAGNLTRDPQTHDFPDGGTVGYLRIAVDGDDGTEYVTAETRRRTLEWMLAQDLHKGDLVIVAGHERTRYNDYRGRDETVLRVVLMATETSWDRATGRARATPAAPPQPSAALRRDTAGGDAPEAPDGDGTGDAGTGDADGGEWDFDPPDTEWR